MRSFEEDDIVKSLVSAYQSASVQTTIIDGMVAMEDRELLTMNETEIIEDGRQAMADLWASKKSDKLD